MLILEIVLLVLTLSLDTFVASIAYGTNRIKIPFSSMIIITTVCAFFLALSVFLGAFLRILLPENITIIISFLILLLLGIYYLFESLIKTYLDKKSKSNQKVKLKLFNIWFIIDIYIDETKADLDKSKTLNPKEALYLGLALSLDSLAIGFGSGLGNINYYYLIILSLISNMFAIWSGFFIGRKFVEKSKINLSWLAGIILIILAVLKLM